MTACRFDSDDAVMRHALDIARRGIGYVEPNPPVGAVIVSPDRDPIAEGWHQRCGGPHAEIHAIEAAGERCRGNDLFVTLEPCSHHGRTPPCADAVIRAGFRRVVVGCTDPAPHVNGCGIAALHDAGIPVEIDICRSEAERLIAPFRMLVVGHRPWIHAKWAMTLDGRIATRTGESQWISSDESRRWVHTLRGRMDAILTGTGTVRADNPLLTARPPGPRDAVRVVLDSHGTSLTRQSRLVQSASHPPVMIFLTEQCTPLRRDELAGWGLETHVVRTDPAGRPQLNDVLQKLAQRQLTHVLVEAGPGLMGAFFDSDCVDEVHVFVAPALVGGREARGPLGGLGIARLSDARTLDNVCVHHLGQDILIEGDVMPAHC